MWQLVWKYCVCSLAWVFIAGPLDGSADKGSEISSYGRGEVLPQTTTVVPWVRPLSPALPDSLPVDGTADGQGQIPRWRRDVLLASGVRLCTQETIQQAIAHHLNYYQLRVCQETVWEAFKIFWDRLPEQEEYQSWLHQCQAGTVSLQEIGITFSQSEEHLALVHKKMAQIDSQSEPIKAPECRSQTEYTPTDLDGPSSEVLLDISRTVTIATPEQAVSVSVPEVTMETPSNVLPTGLAIELSNEIEVDGNFMPAYPLMQQKVQLSMLLAGERWSSELSDPTSIQHLTLSQQFTEKVASALEKLAGFKNVSVEQFRQHTDASGEDVVLVQYVVSLQTGSEVISGEALDFINRQSNQVESSFSQSEKPTMQYTITDLRSYITEALHVNASKSQDESPGTIRQPEHGSNGDILAAEMPPDQPALEAGEEVMMKDPSVSQQEVAGELDVLILDGIGSAPALNDETSTGENTDEEELIVTLAVVTQASPTDTSRLRDESVDSHHTPDISELDSDSASGSGAGAYDLTWEHGADLDDYRFSDTERESDEETEVLADTDTPEADDYVVSTITTVTEEDTDTHITELGGHDDTLTPIVTEKEEDAGIDEADKEAEISTATEEGEKVEDLGDVAMETDEVLKEEDVVVEISPITQQEEGVVPMATYVPAVAIAEEDLTEDEMLVVPVQPVGPAYPTPLSPEKESPFTLIAMATPEDELRPTLVGDAKGTELDYDVFHHTEDGGSGLPAVAHNDDQASIALPANPGRALMVFFSLRVTNMMFSDDLFNKSSAEYKALEQRFLELLVPYLQSNLSNFQNLEILNFRNGSIVVNSRMKFGKPVPRDVTTAVYLILEDFCNTAYQTMNLAIDKYSLDVESGEQADPCKFQACNEFAECMVNRWSGEAECVCNAGYFSVDGTPCQSICDLQPDFCLNDGKCDISPGQGAICRCRVGENWWYRGEHCEEYVSEPLVVGIAIASVAGFLLVASGVIFFLARTLRDQYDKDESEDPIRREDSLPSLERATKYNPMYESDATTGYSHYYRRYPEPPVHSSASVEASTDFSSEEIRHIYENSELTKEEIQDRIRIIELYAKDRQFADFVRQHQGALDSRRESSST